MSAARLRSADFLFTLRVIDARVSVRSNDVLKIDGVRPMTRDEIPPLAVEGSRFVVPWLVDVSPPYVAADARIMSFATDADAANTRAAIDNGVSWIATAHNLLLQVTGDMPEKQFRVFENALGIVGDMPRDLRAK